MSADLHQTRHRLAKLRDELNQCLSCIKSSSTAFKKTQGRIGGVMDAIQIVDEEILAGEQGVPQHLSNEQVAFLAQRRGTVKL